MANHLLRNKLFRYTLLISLCITAFVYIFVFIFSARQHVLIYPLFVGCRFLFQGIVNIYLYEWTFHGTSIANSRQKNLLRYLIGYLICFIFFFCTAPLEQIVSPLPPLPDHHWSIIDNIPSTLWQAAMNHGLVIIFQNLLILEYERANTALENSKLKTANLESANLLLKQQIHPHFLFNALSMMKSLYREDVEAGEAYLSHLVNFMRASLADHQQKIARLSDEIKLCNDYIEMQRIRFEDALVITIDIPEQVLQNGYVPSFSLQSLIENAIKHNEVTEASPLIIRVYLEEGRIITQNNLQLRRLIDGSNGKGLINLIERYRIFSADEVIIHQDNNNFTVSIKVLYNEAGNNRR
ncbi:sensor histidine kinase [Chitinophaga sp. LS1]|uniref:sensor histidine kinase n=1 Tax=Chitinophaga sp. LS1 TaxID=3051176 RepID=UPI002AAB6DFB|nr:histidine kinase [Chitinophaga sp. LS1]WPV64722.1 histidine kinase [Chitinophaga sp. LS1]